MQLTDPILAILAVLALGLALACYAFGIRAGSAQGYTRGHAAGHSSGRSTGIAEGAERIRLLNDDLARHHNIREIEQRCHQQAIEQLMQDCDDRIAEYARRSNPFTNSDLLLLRAAAAKLVLARSTFAGVQANDHAQVAGEQARLLKGLADRLEEILKHQAAPATQEAAA